MTEKQQPEIGSFEVSSGELLVASLIIDMSGAPNKTFTDVKTMIEKIRLMTGATTSDNDEWLTDTDHFQEVATDELGVRARQALQRLGVTNFEELITIPRCEVAHMKNFGEVSLLEVEEMLKKRGLSLAECQDPEYHHKPRN